METRHTFDSLGVEPTLAAALICSGVRPTPFQARVLENTTIDFADVIVDARAAGGGVSSGESRAKDAVSARPTVSERHQLMMIFVAHCVLSSRGLAHPVGLVLANDVDSAAQLHKSVADIAIRCGIVVGVLAKEVQGSRLLTTERNEKDGGDSGSESSHSDEGKPRIIITVPSMLESIDRTLIAHVATFAVEDASHSFNPPLEDILRFVTQPDRATSPKVGDALVNCVNPASAGAGGTASTPNVFMLCLAPLVSLSPAIRYALSRKNRRYYHMRGLSASHPLSSPSVSGGGGACQVAKLGQMYASSNISPPASTQVLYLLYTSDTEHVELLRRVLRMYDDRRVLLLTHRKEIQQLYQSVIKWDIYNPTGRARNKGSKGGTATDRVRCIQRVDTAERKESTLMAFVGGRVPTKRGGAAKTCVVRPTLLIGWGTFTAIDLMDVDVVIQYYPPPKSITREECVEFMQVLHTTVDPCEDGVGRRTTLITFLSTGDFAHAAFFMERYGLRSHILNISPSHRSFEFCLSSSAAVLEYKLRKQHDMLTNVGARHDSAAQNSTVLSQPRSRRSGMGNRGADSTARTNADASTDSETSSNQKTTTDACSRGMVVSRPRRRRRR